MRRGRGLVDINCFDLCDYERGRGEGSGGRENSLSYLQAVADTARGPASPYWGACLRFVSALTYFLWTLDFWLFVFVLALAMHWFLDWRCHS